MDHQTHLPASPMDCDTQEPLSTAIITPVQPEAADFTLDAVNLLKARLMHPPLCPPQNVECHGLSWGATIQLFVYFIDT